jgi:hypothetical protein
MDNNVSQRDPKSVPNRPDLSFEKPPQNLFNRSSLASRRAGTLKTRFEGESAPIQKQSVDYESVLLAG